MAIAPSIRTLFITKEVPYPPKGGVSLRNWQNINIMMKFGLVAVFSASNWTPKHSSLPGVVLWKHTNVTTQRSGWENRQRRLWWLRRRRHPDADWAYSNRAAQELDELLTKFQPDLVIFEEVWLYPYLSVVKRHQCRIIFDEHNIEAPLFQQKYPSFEGLRSRAKATIQLSHLTSIEGDFVRQANQVWVCSDDDASLIKTLYGTVSHTQVIPNGMNVAQYDPVRLGQCRPPSGLEDTRRTLLFVGLLSYAPNTEAAELLIDQIYPRLREIDSDCRLLLVGRNPNQKMQEAAKREPGIIVTGGVPDVLQYLAAASIVIVPLLQGGGTRLKILEAFAAGCPVVSTAKGAEGLKAKDGEHLLIRNEVDAIVEGVCQLWAEPALGEKLARSAYELVKSEYSWEAVGRKVDQVIQDLF
ncbi:glycosyltransferase family 4 protein [Coleofasciculus sp.]|uniref:glycosyltransferase family 4 protein n=1 Tax=Coleofasciculus sp. TaxID=3100458 RepID=UPI0039F7A380